MLIVGNEGFVHQSKEWHAWRAEGIGASDAPIIMNASPWKTPFDLFLEKTGQKKDKKKSSASMQRGNDLEPVARAYYELKSAIEFKADCFFEDDELPFLRASLDGWNEELKIALEIKCPGKSDHLLAVKGQVPEKYIYQVQHQIMCAKADRADYFSFDGSRGVHVHVYPDLDLIKRMREAEFKFWECVKSGAWA